MDTKGLCHICGKVASKSCKMCGRTTCESHLHNGICTSCSSGRQGRL